MAKYMKKRFVIFAIPISILVLIDQAIKTIIANTFIVANFSEEAAYVGNLTHITLISGVLYFRPYQNIHGGSIQSLFGYIMPLYQSIILYTVTLCVIIMAYRLLKFWASDWDKYKYLPDVAFVLLVSAVFSRFIDAIFWGGVIDYLQLFDWWFIFDLIDVTNKVGVAAVVLYAIIFLVKYFKLSKEERKEVDEKCKILPWLKAGLPLEYNDRTNNINT